jgi:predicted RNA-binding protein with RPS1 domain
MDLLTEEQLEAVKQLPYDSNLDKMIKLYEFFAISPVVDSYISMYDQIADINEQIKIKEVEIDGVKKVIGRIRLDDSEEKGIDRLFRYFDKIVDFQESLDKLRSKMLPSQMVDVAMLKKMKKVEK